jgi:DNA-binding Lrp family transcriptional regulator
VITGYRANLDPAKMGFNFLAIVFATLKEGDKKAVSAFEEAVEEIRKSCWRSACLAIRTT